MPSVNPHSTKVSFVLQQMQVNTVDPTSGVFFLLPFYEGPILVSVDMAQQDIRCTKVQRTTIRTGLSTKLFVVVDIIY